MRGPTAEPPSFVSRQVADSRRFYLQLQPPPGLALTVVCGGWERVTPDYRIDRGDFPFLCLEYVAGGSGYLSLAGREHELSRGSVFAYGPRVAHRIAARPDDPLLKYYVDFSGRQGLDLLRSAGLEPGRCLHLAGPADIGEDFERLLAAAADLAAPVERIAALQLEILLVRLAAATGPGQGHEQAHQTYLRCRRYLEEHCLDLATAEEAAEACHVHPAYLSRLFAKHGGESPYRYLLRRKMMHAAALLDGGGRIVREVADLLGMDPFHFSRVFKRVHGLPPRDFIVRRGNQSAGA